MKNKLALISKVNKIMMALKPFLFQESNSYHLNYLSSFYTLKIKFEDVIWLRVTGFSFYVNEILETKPFKNP